MAIAPVDIADHFSRIDDQRRRMRDMDRIESYAVIQPVSFGYGAIFVEQEGHRNWVLGEVLLWFEHASALFGSDIDQVSTRVLDVAQM